MLHLRGLTQLTKLSLFGCIVDDGVAFMLISNLTRLQSLALQGNQCQTDAVLPAIALHLRGLRDLEFMLEKSMTSASYAFLSELAELTALITLSLDMNVGELSDDGQRHQLNALFGGRLVW
jgi:hypothetical protein